MQTSVDVRVDTRDRDEWQVGRYNLMEKRREEGRKWDDLERYLRYWQGRCGFARSDGEGELMTSTGL